MNSGDSADDGDGPQASASIKKVEPMKKYLLALAAFVGAGTVSAQSSVTIFGVVDAAYRSATTSGVGTTNSVISGGFSSSRYGFRGQEDLGGGLSASFWLESFLAVDTGAATPAGFQRRSTVSLSGSDWGEVRLGRDYTPTHSNWSRYDPFNYVGIGAVQLLILSATGTTPVTAAFGANPNTVQRIGNGIQYILPRNAWGIDGGLVYAFGEGGTAANDQHNGKGARIGYASGPILVSFAHMRTSNNLTTGDFKDTALAGSYNTGFLSVSGGVRRLQYLNSKQNNYLLAASMPLGVHELKASWNRAVFGGSVGAVSIANDRADQYAVGYVYNLSKRSRLYATYAKINNKGNARFVIQGALAGAAGARSSGFETGINHEF